MDRNDLKEFYIKFLIKLRIYKDIRSYFSDYLNRGEIVKLLSFDVDNFATCPSYMPVEYCSKDNRITEAKILTEYDEIYTIREEYLGLNFESSCDEWILKIFDKYDRLIGTTEDYLKYKKILEDNKKNKKEEKKKKKLEKKYQKIV